MDRPPQSPPSPDLADREAAPSGPALRPGLRLSERVTSAWRRGSGRHLAQEVKGKMLPDNTYAQYFGRRGTDPKKMIRWEEFYDKDLDDLDELVVRVIDSVFQRDEEIVAVLSHEMHELNELRRIFEESGGAISMQRLHSLINPGIAKNLHDQAWMSPTSSSLRCAKE